MRYEMSKIFQADAIAAELETLPGWQYDADEKAIKREFVFSDFSEAFAFMARIALLAEKAGHHPDWSNSYNKLDVSLSTHSAGGVTQKDIDLATAIAKLNGGEAQ